MTPERLGKYEIRGTLGQGAMGLVYDGWDPLILRRVAIKTVSLAQGDDADAAEGVERFRREAQAAGRLQHPNIVSVFDFGETETLAFIVMEFMDGGTLKDVLDREKKIAPVQACDMMCQVLAALAYSHARGVVHRDVKPANIMLDHHGAVKLGDFGIARLDSSSMTLVGDVLGTPAYMAPEQFLGETADARADIFAAGATLFHLLTGSRPYEGSRTTVRQKVLTATRAPSASDRAPEVPAALDAALCRAMARHADDRFQNASDFAAAIRASLLPRAAAPASDNDATVFVRTQNADATLATASRPAPPPPPPPAEAAAPAPARRGRSFGLLAAGAVFVATAGAAAWYFTQSTALTALRPAELIPQPVASPPSVKAPTQQQATPPPLSPADAARAAGVAATGVDCALARVQPAASGIDIAGIVGAGAPRAALRAAVQQAAGGLTTEWASVRDVADTFCAIMSTIRPAWGGDGLALGLEDQNDSHLAPVGAVLLKGMLIKPSVGGLDFPAYLRVDYLQRDGSVEHMYPRVGVPANKKFGAVAADPERLLPAGGTLVLGRNPSKPGANPTWDVSEPYGTDLIIAVASSKTLNVPDRPNNEPDARPYFSALKQAIDAASADGARLAAGALPVDTAAK